MVGGRTINRDTSGYAEKYDAVTAEIKSYQPYRKRSSMSRWQGTETGKRVDRLGL